MMKDNKPMAGLRAASTQYFNQIQLSEDKLDQFEAMLGQATGQSSSKSAQSQTHTGANGRVSILSNPWVKLGGYAASVLLLVGILLGQSTDNLPLNIANEVAMNHIKMKPLEVSSQNLNVLRGYFTELDFSVTSSAEFTLPQASLLGGRYCSILGVSAAQIRYLDSSHDGKVTLYQVGYDKDRYGELPDIGRGETPITLEVNGILVRIWVEKGLLMAEAKQMY